MQKQRGFSLLELTIVLLVIGSTVFIARSLAPSVSDKTDSQQQGASFQADSAVLKDAEQQLRGYILSHNRLPCPDITGDGLEDCGTAAAPTHSGALPYRTMKLPQPALNAHNNALRYGVYRNPSAVASQDMDLARDGLNRFQPLLPEPLDPRPGSTNVPESPPAIIASNALDFCWALRSVARQGVQNANFTFVGPQAQALNQAFVLADPGQRDANSNGALFDGNNAAGPGFDLPNRPQTSTYDDQTLSMGFFRLAARLQCPEILASANGAARTAFAAHDQSLLTVFFEDLMKHAHNEAIDGVVMSSVGVGLAAADVVIAGGQLTISIADAVISRGASAVVGAILSAVATIPAAAAVAVAGVGLNDAIKGEEGALDAKDDVKTTADNERNLAIAARNTAIKMQNRGWLQ